MIKNITFRFVIVFTIFLSAGALLILTLQEATSLNEKMRSFNEEVDKPLHTMEKLTRQLYIDTLEVRLTKTDKNQNQNREKDDKFFDDQTYALLQRVEHYNDVYLHDKALKNSLRVVKRDLRRFQQERLNYFKHIRHDSASSLRKLHTHYMLVLKALLNDIDGLREYFTLSFKNFMEDEQKKTGNTFYLASILAVAALIILTFLLLEVSSINAKLKDALQEQEDYQEKLAKVNQELAKYSEKLEIKVKEKTDEALQHLLRNPLTNLPNRVSFIEKLEQTSRASVALFNIDRFQAYNDLFGSKIGDEIITQYAKYLRNIIPYIYELYHLQGDEFAILESRQKSAQTFLAMVSQAVKYAKEFHFISNNGEILLQASIGVVIHEKEPLVKADMALKHAKNTQESFVIYSEQIIEPHRYLENITLTKELTSAIKEERIIPYLQPICDTKTLQPYKYEVLARMKDSRGNIVPPAQFIPLAKKIRLYPELTRVIFKRAMDVIERESLRLSINISADDIHHIPTRDYIIDRLALSQYSHFVTFELLESEEAKNYEEIQRFIEKVKKYGVSIAIDDFGSGYSNFAKILKLKVDFLKIDGSFIKKIHADSDAREFVEIIHHLATNFKIKTVSEFVCNEEVYSTVKKIGIDFVQGFYIAEPQPLEKILASYKNPSAKSSRSTTLTQENEVSIN